MPGICLRSSVAAALAFTVLTASYAQSTPPTPEEVLAGWGGTDPRLDLNADGIVNGADHAVALSLLSNSESVVPTLVAGAGFTSETAEPAARGNSSQPGYAAKAMARWNFVPCQTFSQSFAVGVVAFHAYGINRVEFSLNNGPWTAVNEPRLNTESGTVEYFVRVDPSVLASGEFEIRAIVYPNVGACRVLGGSIRDADAERGEYGMFFTANPAGALPAVECFVSPSGNDTTGDGSASSPFMSIMKAAKSIALASGGKADGGVINLLPGNHILGTYTSALLTTTDRRWLTIRPAPGVGSAAAPIVALGSSSGLAIPHVRFEGITFKPNGTTNTIVRTNSSTTAPRFLWLDGCRFEGIGRQTSGDWCNGWQRIWSTNCYVTQSRNGIVGELVRNCTIDTIGSDAFTGARLALNSTVRRIDRSGTDFHPDFFQLYAAPGAVVENRIVFGCRMLEASQTQGLFAGNGVSIRDIAIVDTDVMVDTTLGFMYAFQFAGPTAHMLVQDCMVGGNGVWRVDLAFTGADIVIRDSSFNAGPNPAPLAGVSVFD